MAVDEAGDDLARARMHLARHEFADAEAAARREIRSDPYSAAAHIVLASALIGQGRGPEARVAAERAVALEPNHSAGQIALASAWLAESRAEQAEIAARRAIALDPASADAHMVLGNTLLARGASADAERELDKAIALEPSDPAGERIWKRSQAPVVIAISIAAFLAYHALRLLGPRFTDWRVAVLLLALTAVLILAVLIGLAVQRRRLSRLSPAERMELVVESRRRRAEGRSEYALHVVVLAAVIGGLSVITILFGLGQKASLQMAVGDCFSVDRMVSIEQVSTIPCLLPHDFEVFAVLTESSPPGAPFPGSAALHKQLRTRCEQLYADYVGVPFSQDAPTDIDTFAPEESYWRLNIRSEYCALSDWHARQMVGSRRGAT